MNSPGKTVLITGLPGVGKTTLIKKLSEQLRDLHPVGFYTSEIREKGVRKGFELACFDGRRGILSHTDIKGPHRVGKYGVDMRGFQDFLESIPFLDPATNLIIIDEIGKMECLSDTFRALALDILDSDKLLIATISLKGDRFIEGIKKREDVMLCVITHENRDSLQSEITEVAQEVSRFFV